ncbi:hypothetical protein H6P81_015244 [Aristolochia fimbriata]|uniref:RING-type E3 ubiquitin transferase n=1 Tax=Aristolochia fimbriata TaxID=158543 RepID=A0AAV7E6U0_ARIFI|nr:hypothetical protein H6P81_015244 [Aristolochia fimbriata]
METEKGMGMAGEIELVFPLRGVLKQLDVSKGKAASTPKIWVLLLTGDLGILVELALLVAACSGCCLLHTFLKSGLCLVSDFISTFWSSWRARNPVLGQFVFLESWGFRLSDTESGDLCRADITGGKQSVSTMSTVGMDNSLKDSVPVSITGKVMLVAIIVLFLAVVFVIFLHLYAKWFWRRNGNSLSRRSGFVFAPARGVPASRQGLDASILGSLPVLVYKSEDFKEGLECAVCLCEVSDGEKARLLPKCNHGFHVDCIDMWFQSHSTCPICRTLVASESSASSDSELPVSEMSSAEGQSAESVNFPTNVLFWGTQDQVNTGRTSAEGGPSSSATNEDEGNRKIVIEIPRRLADGSGAASSPSSQRFTEEETKSPVTRLRSLRRLLSREKRLVVPCSPTGGDIEQGFGSKSKELPLPGEGLPIAAIPGAALLMNWEQSSLLEFTSNSSSAVGSYSGVLLSNTPWITNNLWVWGYDNTVNSKRITLMEPLKLHISGPRLLGKCLRLSVWTFSLALSL